MPPTRTLLLKIREEGGLVTRQLELHMQGLRWRGAQRELGTLRISLGEKWFISHEISVEQDQVLGGVEAGVW